MEYIWSKYGDPKGILSHDLIVYSVLGSLASDYQKVVGLISHHSLIKIG